MHNKLHKESELLGLCVCVPRGRDEFLPLIPSVLGQAMDCWEDGCISTYQGEGMSVLQLVW